MKTAVALPFGMKSGAGGFSISPHVTFRATIGPEGPPFRVISYSSLGSGATAADLRSPERLVKRWCSQAFSFVLSNEVFADVEDRMTLDGNSRSPRQLHGFMNSGWLF